MYDSHTHFWRIVHLPARFIMIILSWLTPAVSLVKRVEWVDFFFVQSTKMDSLTYLDMGTFLDSHFIFFMDVILGWWMLLYAFLNGLCIHFGTKLKASSGKENFMWVGESSHMSLPGY